MSTTWLQQKGTANRCLPFSECYTGPCGSPDIHTVGTAHTPRAHYCSKSTLLGNFEQNVKGSFLFPLLHACHRIAGGVPYKDGYSDYRTWRVGQNWRLMIYEAPMGKRGRFMGVAVVSVHHNIVLDAARLTLERPTTIGGAPPPPQPGHTAPHTKVIIVGKNGIYIRENLPGPFLVHKILPPPPPL